MNACTEHPLPNKASHLNQTRKRALLIVDDDEGPRKSLEVIFQEEYTVFTAENGPDALALAKEHPIDAAILDIRMAGMTGIELLQELKAFDPSIEALMLTGYESVETIRQALRYGACDYLSKPFDVDTIRSAVANAMERRTLSEEIAATQQRISTLQVELQQQNMREQITRNKGEIYASILHDINGPLTIIAGYIQFIDIDLNSMKGFGEGHAETLREHLRTINRQVNHCIEISQRYLGFLRRKPAGEDTVSINKTFEDLKILLQKHPSRKGNQLSVIPLVGEPLAVINGADLIQLIVNLTVNAFQSTTEPHRVTISGEVVAGPLRLVPSQEGASERIVFSPMFENKTSFVKLAIEDNGPGMPPTVLAKIFQPFFTTKGAEGTGLGLSIVHRLVDQAGGAIHVCSEPGKGTVFYIYLKLA